MSAATRDATVVATLDEGALANSCVPPALRDALVMAVNAMKLRVQLPAQDSTVGVSPLQDNLARLVDGKIYVPAAVQYTIEEQVATLTTTTAPGTGVPMTLPVPGVADLAAAFTNLRYDISPADSAVNISPPVVEGSNLKITFYRVDIGGSSPYPEITIRVRGTAVTLPAPVPA